MANAIASMAALSLETSLAGTRLLSSSSIAAVSAGKPGVVAVRAHQGEDVPSQSRRSLLSLVAASLASTVVVRESRAASSIKVEGPPPPSGGLPGTENSDQARDTDLPLKERFYLQPKSPAEATERIKESVKAIMDVKSLIDKKAWPYVQNGLRSSASYLRYDLNTVLSAKSKEEKKSLKALTTKLLDSINNLDYAARSKSVPEAEKYYSETVGLLKDVLSQM